MTFYFQRETAGVLTRTNPATRRVRRNAPSYSEFSKPVLSLVLTIGWVCWTTGSLAQSLTGQDNASRRPNIIFLLTDDQHWDTLGCMGNPVIHTPNLDRLAREGVLFRNAFVTTSVCGPSRASILTGTYGRARGVGDLSRIMAPVDLAATYPAVLRDHGYETGQIGKWDVGVGETGFQMGINLFDYWGGDRYHGNYWHEADCPLVTNNGRQSKAAIRCTCPPEGSLPRVGHVGMQHPLHFDQDIVPLKVKQFLRCRDREKPFFLAVSFRGPKDPWSDYPTNVAKMYESDVMPLPKTATREEAARQPQFLQKSMASDYGRRMVGDQKALAEEMRKHYRLVSTIDGTVAKLRELLAEEKLTDNTIIIFTTDNGEFFGEHGFWGKWLPYEDSIRVPLIVFDPRLPAEKRGAQRDEMALNIDLAPTFLALTGCAIPRSMQGQDLTPLLRGERPVWRTDWFYEHTWTADGRIAPSEAVRSEEWKFIRFTGETPFVEQLFNLKADPDETINRIADTYCASVANKMRKQLEAYQSKLVR